MNSPWRNYDKLQRKKSLKPFTKQKLHKKHGVQLSIMNEQGADHYQKPISNNLISTKSPSHRYLLVK
ncbi:hypothetical protein O9992_21210 [Vibrio lentus]|nr:hypothetical protein [Vibrio lentus]